MAMKLVIIVCAGGPLVVVVFGGEDCNVGNNGDQGDDGSTCGGDDIFKACDNVGDVGNDGVCVSCTSCGGDGVGMQVMLLKLLIIFYVGDT